MKTCTHCQKEISRPVSKNTIRPFCDTACYASWQKENNFKDRGIIPQKPNRTCKVCGKRFPGLARANYCSDACRTVVSHATFNARPAEERKAARLASAPEHKCANCGKPFRRYNQASKYCSMDCFGLATKAPFIIKKGYKKILRPDHARADGKGYVFEHIIVMEGVIGRSLKAKEEIHHLDHDKTNNDPGNLKLCASHREHMQFHNPSRGVARTS